MPPVLRQVGRGPTGTNIAPLGWRAMDQADDPKFWRARAMDVRVMAERMTEVEKQGMLQIALEYERMAYKVEDSLKDSTGHRAQC